MGEHRCPVDQSVMEPVFSDNGKAAGDFRLDGWWCTQCNRWDKAIGRERLFTPEGLECA